MPGMKPVFTATILLVALPLSWSAGGFGSAYPLSGDPVPEESRMRMPDVFLVDDDEGEDYEYYFTSALDSLGLRCFHYDVHAAGESPVRYLSDLPSETVVVWFTGDDGENILTPEEEALEVFLDGGGKLFMKGQNIAEYLAGTGSDLLSDYFHVSYGGLATEYLCRGSEANPVGRYLDRIATVGPGGAYNQYSRDVLVPAEDRMEVLSYALGDTLWRGTAGVTVQGRGCPYYRAVLFGFGFEAISRPVPQDTTYRTRVEVMKAVYSWLRDRGHSIDLRLIPPADPRVPPGGMIEFRVGLDNGCGGPVRGDLWLSVVGPGGGEVSIPPDLTGWGENPVSGELGTGESAVLRCAVRCPVGAPPGHYLLVGRIGRYGSYAWDVDRFGVEVVSGPGAGPERESAIALEVSRSAPADVVLVSQRDVVGMGMAPTACGSAVNRMARPHISAHENP